jgi:hypothetical protein
MATLKGAKTVGAPFSNDIKVVRVIYDYSVDGGQVEDNTVLTADGAILVRCIGAIVETAMTSGGSATIDLGKGTSGAEFVSAEAYTSFSAAAFYASESAAFVKLADGEVINMGVATAALTAGKVEFIFEIAQA